MLFIVFFTLFLLSQSDSEYMAGQLSAFGYSLSDSPEEADLWLINTWASSLFPSYLTSFFFFWSYNSSEDIYKFHIL